MAFRNGVKAIGAVSKNRAILFLLGALVAPFPMLAQYPSLLVTGLPCPGGQGEPTNSHALIWQCRSAYERDTYRPWRNWQETVQIDYGDVVAVTWFDQCRGHASDWNFLRIDLVTTNQNGSAQT